MSTTTLGAADAAGPMEREFMRSAAFRDAANPNEVTRTHWHIAIANGLGWGFDGMDGVIFALCAPMILKEFALDVPTYRTGLQIALLVGIPGIYFWPWLADRYGRRTLLAINIALFSLLMPVVAIAPTWVFFIFARCAVGFALNGEWALGSMLVAETWPARLRGRALGITRGTWCLGASLAGAIATYVAAVWGWRAAFMVPAVIALLAIYVRATCPESPYWVRTQDRKRRIANTLAAGQSIGATDQAWYHKADRVAFTQLFLPDTLRNTVVATFVACCSTCIFGTVGGWMPLYLATERHWATTEYGTFYIWWGIVGSFGLIISGWMSDRFGRRPAFVLMLLEGALFMTLWVYTNDHTLLWVYGLLWSIGFLGFWGPSTTLTAELFPTRIRGAGNGFVWSVAWLVGFVLWPFATVALQQSTGSFAAAFLCIPVFMVMMAVGVWLVVPEHRGQALDSISV